MAKEKERAEGESNKTSGIGSICRGSSCAFNRRVMEVHSSKELWPPCWKCQAPLGCPKCAASTVQEVLCERCLVWGTREALVHHGPIANVPTQVAKRNGRYAPRLEDYPHAWLPAYAHSGVDFREELLGRAPYTDRGRSTVMSFFDMFKRGVSLPEEPALLEILSRSEHREEQEAAARSQEKTERATEALEQTSYWTLERAEARKEHLHRQLAWLGRRNEAERNGQEFAEEKPGEDI